MNPPRHISVDSATDEDPLELLTAALQSGRLVEMLRDGGLSRDTVRELMRPERSWRLRSILDDHLSKGGERSLSSDPSDRPSHRGPLSPCKVLEFRSPEAVTR
jgi:hypothetical protein